MTKKSYGPKEWKEKEVKKKGVQRNGEKEAKRKKNSIVCCISTYSSPDFFPLFE